MTALPKLITVYFVIAFACFYGCNPKEEAKAETKKVTDTLKATAYGNRYENVDQSPLDICYYPADYTEKKMAGVQQTNLPVSRVIYSRPHKKGRLIFGDSEKSLCPYNKPWRLGANEATEIEFFQPVVINGNNIATGRYVLYAIPYPDKWIIVLNSNVYSWGLQIDPEKDMARIEVVTQEQNPIIEDFTIVFEKAPFGANLIMTWDNVKTSLPITFSEI